MIAIVGAFKQYIDYSSRYDAYLMGLVDERDLNEAMEEFAVYPNPDEKALSKWIELVFRETGLELYPDELATIFGVPGDQIDCILDGLAKKGLVIQMRDNGKSMKMQKTR